MVKRFDCLFAHLRSNDKVRIWGLIRFSWESVGTSSFPSLASFLEVSLPLRMRQDIRQESAQEREGTTKCVLTVMRRSFLRGVRRSNVPETAAEYLIVAEFSRESFLPLLSLVSLMCHSAAPQRSLLTPRSRNKELWDGLKDNESEQLLVQAWIKGRITYHRGIRDVPGVFHEISSTGEQEEDNLHNLPSHEQEKF